MPSFRSLARIIVALLLLGGFYLAPRFLGPGRGPLGITASRVRELSLSNVQGGAVTVVRDGEGRWRFAEDTGLEPDQGRINNFLLALDRSAWKPAGAALGKKQATITLKAGLSTRTLELGDRREPFARQLAQIGDRVYEVSEDLGASLGLWAGTDMPSSAPLHDVNLYDLMPQEVVEIERLTPFTDYHYTAREAHEGYTWSLGGRKAGQALDNAGLEHYRQQLLWLSAGRPATAAERRTQEFPYTLNFTTSQGTSVRLRLSGPLGNGNEHLVRLEAPRQATTIISSVSFRRLLAPTRQLIRNLPEATFPENQVVSIMAARDGVQFRMQRNGNQWQMVRPVQSTAWIRIEGGPGIPPSDAAREYVTALSNMVSQELFVLAEETAARRQMYAAAFQNPAARVRVELNGDRTLDYVLSAAIPGIQERFLQAGGRDLIVDGRLLETLVPPLDQLLENQ